MSLLQTRARAIGATIASAVGAVVFAQMIGEGAKPAAWIPIAAYALAATAVHFEALGAQLFARGLWWSNLVLGLLLAAFGSGRESRVSVALTLTCALSLALADRRALVRASENAGFRPAAFLGTLQLMMVLALGDAQTLLLFSFIERGDAGPVSATFLLLAAGFLLGFVGIYRLALWGAFASMASAAGLVAALVTRFVRPDHELTRPLLAIAAVQLAVPLPMLFSMVTKRKLPALSARARELSALAVVGLTVAASLAMVIHRHRY